MAIETPSANPAATDSPPSGTAGAASGGVPQTPGGNDNPAAETSRTVDSSGQPVPSGISETPASAASTGAQPSPSSPNTSSAGSDASGPQASAESSAPEGADHAHGEPSPPDAESAQQPQAPTVRQLSFGERLAKNAGNGILSGMVAGGIRVGFMAFCIGTAFALIGTLGSATFVGGLLATAVPLGIAGLIGGAVFVGGFSFVKSLFTSAKDQIFDPNQGAVMEKSQGQGKEQAPSQEKDGAGQDAEMGAEVPQGRFPDDQSPRPYLTDDAMTQADPDQPPARKTSQAQPQAAQPTPPAIPAEAVTEPDMAGQAKPPNPSESAAPAASGDTPPVVPIIETKSQAPETPGEPHTVTVTIKAGARIRP